jgi:hypothetical protein
VNENAKIVRIESFAPDQLDEVLRRARELTAEYDASTSRPISFGGDGGEAPFVHPSV